jgi:signal transduction histidine kinase
LNWQLTFVPRRHLPLLTEVYTVAVLVDDKPLRLRWVLRDISLQHMLEENLHYERERLQVLSRRLVDMKEAERGKLARELYDKVGQLLTGLKLSLEYSGQQQLVAQTKIPDAIAIVTQLMEQIHTLSLQLRPPMLDTLGLIPTLQWHFKRYTAQTHIQIHFQSDLFEYRSLSQIELTIYQLIQEALTNIARHAKTQEAFVSVCEQGKVLRIMIEDHGVGFNHVEVQQTHQSRGLTAMQARIDALGGQLTLDSTPGRGTHIQATIDLE